MKKIKILLNITHNGKALKKDDIVNGDLFTESQTKRLEAQGAIAVLTEEKIGGAGNLGEQEPQPAKAMDAPAEASPVPAQAASEPKKKKGK